MENGNCCQTCTGEAIESAIQAVFMQYSTQLSETAHRPLTAIVMEQIGCEPWMDVYGMEHPVKCPMDLLLGVHPVAFADSLWD